MRGVVARPSMRATTRRSLRSTSAGACSTPEPPRDVGPVVDVDLLDVELAALLARDVREQALHPARRAGPARGEEHEEGAGVGVHGCSCPQRANRRRAGTQLHWPAMGGWYWIGVAVGLGAALGVFVSGLVRIPLAAIVVAAAAGAGVGVALDVWQPGGSVDAIGGGVGAAVGALGAVQIVRGALRRGGTRGGTATLVAGAALVAAGLAFVPVARVPRGARASRARREAAPPPARALRRFAHARPGLTDAREEARPHRRRRDDARRRSSASSPTVVRPRSHSSPSTASTGAARSVFPSLTPVCLSSIATGAGPGGHHIPHLVWWHRKERRIVEYGSSFAALRAAGMTQSITDTIYNLNRTPPRRRRDDGVRGARRRRARHRRGEHHVLPRSARATCRRCHG